MVNSEREVFTVQELADYLNFKRQEVYSLIHNRELSATKVGRSYQIPYAEFERWLDEQTRP